MKISKSLLTPSWSVSRSRSRDQPMSHPTSFTRKLPNNGVTTIKVPPQASPMFTTKNNPEPSSPKVTCIGQVRSKSKKKKRLNTTINGDLKQNGGNNCYDLSCLFPCGGDNRKWANGSNAKNAKNSCARWLVRLEDGEGGKRREIELVVGEESEDEEMVIRRTSLRRRRHVLEDFEIDDEKFEGKEIEEGRISICLPPKNALLLMRCRSDPTKIAALTNRVNGEESREELMGIVEEELEIDETQEASSMEIEKINQIQEESREISSSSSMESASVNEIKELENTHQEKDVNDQDFESRKQDDEDQDKNGEFISSSSPVLPDCLLLMMFEPKLSMEVSKETWVCSTDFVRCLPKKQNQKAKQNLVKSSSSLALVEEEEVRKDDQSDESKKVKVVIPPQTGAALPPRSSCSLPAKAVSMADMIENKLLNGGGGGYEPFMLKRCKSEPMRGGAKLTQDPCF